MPYEERHYRRWVTHDDLTAFRVQDEETDLAIRASKDIRAQARTILHRLRAEIKQIIRQQPEFLTHLSPLDVAPEAPEIVRRMAAAAAQFDVGPMAAVAGAVAQMLGQALLPLAPELMIENGGDVFLKTDRPRVIALYAGKASPFSGRIKLRIDSTDAPLGVCTSSGTVGHSLSFGRADAVVAIASDAAVADAAATAIANRVQTSDDIAPALEREQARGLLDGLLITLADKIGACGRIELV